MGIPDFMKAPRPVRRGANPDSWSLPDTGARYRPPFREEQVLAGHEVDAVVVAPDAKRLGEPRRPGTQQAVRGHTPVLSHELDSLQGLGGPKQHGTSLFVPPRDDVHTKVHAVSEIDVQVSGSTEHHAGSRGQAAKGVAGRIVLLVRLGLDDSPNHGALVEPPNQELPQDVSSHHGRGPSIERSGKRRKDAARRGQRLPFWRNFRNLVSGQVLITSSLVSQPRWAVPIP